MVEVVRLVARSCSAHVAELAFNGNEIDERAADAKLVEADVHLFLLEPCAEHVDVETHHPLQVCDPEHDVIDSDDIDHCSSAATPGSVRPSIHSRNAPPAVETKLKSCVTPA